MASTTIIDAFVLVFDSTTKNIFVNKLITGSTTIDTTKVIYTATTQSDINNQIKALGLAYRNK